MEGGCGCTAGPGERMDWKDESMDCGVAYTSRYKVLRVDATWPRLEGEKTRHPGMRRSGD